MNGSRRLLAMVEHGVLMFAMVVGGSKTQG